MKLRLFRLSGAIGIAVGTIGLALLFFSPIAIGHPSAPLLSLKPVAADKGNLLTNPDFENGYTRSLPCCNNIAVPIGWNVHWYTDTAVVINDITYTFKQPEVKIIDNTIWPFCDGCAPNIPPRIHSGRYAVDAFALFAPQDTTLYQQVGHIPLGAVVTGSAWLHAWASSCNPFPQNATIQVPAISLQDHNDGNNGYRCADGYWPIETTHMLVGIDPYGGTDPRAASVVWNWNASNPAWWGPYDYYSPTLPVTATAHSYTVTFFLRGVTQMPTRYDDLYFDTTRLTYRFPIEWQIDQGQEWPLTTAITIGLQTPVSLTHVSVALQDPIGQLGPIASLGSSANAPFTSSWQFTPTLAGTYLFTLTAHELPDPLTRTIAVQTLPFNYEQDHLLSSTAISDAASITLLLSSPITLTDLSSSVSDPLGAPLTTTWVTSDFDLERYRVTWQFTAESSGWHTVTLNAAEFMQPFVQPVLVAASRIYLPMVLRDF